MCRNIDLDAMTVAAGLDLQAMDAAAAAFGHDMAGDRAGSGADHDVVWPEGKNAITTRNAFHSEIEGTTGEERPAGLDRDGKHVGLTDEAGNERGLGPVVNLFRRANLFDGATIENHDAVGEFYRLVLIVGDEDGGVAGTVVKIAQPVPELATDLGVERAERLVEQQETRLDRKRAGERDTLALAAGQLRRIAPAEIAELDQVEQFADTSADRRRGPGGATPGAQ